MSSKLRIGVISDTHGVLPQSIGRVFADVDLILHAGDFGDSLVIDHLETIAPVKYVRGNTDFDSDADRVVYEDIEGVRVMVIHRMEEAYAYRAGEPSLVEEYNPNLIIFGHTHRPTDEFRRDIRLINPGSARSPRGGSNASAAVLEIADGKILSVNFASL